MNEQQVQDLVNKAIAADRYKRVKSDDTARLPIDKTNLFLSKEQFEAKRAKEKDLAAKVEDFRLKALAEQDEQAEEEDSEVQTVETVKSKREIKPRASKASKETVQTTA